MNSPLFKICMICVACHFYYLTVVINVTTLFHLTRLRVQSVKKLLLSLHMASYSSWEKYDVDSALKEVDEASYKNDIHSARAVSLWFMQINCFYLTMSCASFSVFASTKSHACFRICSVATKRAVSTMRHNEAQALENLKMLSQTLKSHLRVQTLLNADVTASISDDTTGRRRRVKGRRARMMRRAAEKHEHNQQPDKTKTQQQEQERASKILEQFVRSPSHVLVPT